MSNERHGASKTKLIDGYRVLYEEYPQLKNLALGYWNKVEGLDIEQEETLFNDVALKISNQLLNNPLFLQAIDRVGKDPIECAIIESFYIIETVLDV